LALDICSVRKGIKGSQEWEVRREAMTAATSKLRILGKPKPPQTGQFSSKMLKSSAAGSKQKPAKKA